MLRRNVQKLYVSTLETSMCLTTSSLSPSYRLASRLAIHLLNPIIRVLLNLSNPIMFHVVFLSFLLNLAPLLSCQVQGT